MTSEHHDRELKRLFKRLKPTRGSIPAFESVLRHPSGHGRLLPAAIRLAAAAGLFVLLIVVLIPRGEEIPEGSSLPLSSWKSPTDFLLRAPGSEVYQEVPRLGEFPFSLSPMSTKENS